MTVRAGSQSRDGRRSSTSDPPVSKSPRSTEFSMERSDCFNMADAIFDGGHMRPGWIHAFANAKGRNHIHALFPEADIEWPELPFPGFPDDWRSMQVNLTGCVSTMTTNLPLELMPAGSTIDDCTRDQLALLLAFGVMRAGGRSAIIRKHNDEVRVQFFKAREN
jgi:hypothetical protein